MKMASFCSQPHVIRLFLQLPRQTFHPPFLSKTNAWLVWISLMFLFLGLQRRLRKRTSLNYVTAHRQFYFGPTMLGSLSCHSDWAKGLVHEILLLSIMIFSKEAAMQWGRVTLRNFTRPQGLDMSTHFRLCWRSCVDAHSAEEIMETNKW